MKLTDVRYAITHALDGMTDGNIQQNLKTIEDMFTAEIRELSRKADQIARLDLGDAGCRCAYLAIFDYMEKHGYAASTQIDRIVQMNFDKNVQTNQVKLREFARTLVNENRSWYKPWGGNELVDTVEAYLAGEGKVISPITDKGLNSNG